MAPASTFKMFSWKRKPAVRSASTEAAVPQVIVSSHDDEEPSEEASSSGGSPPAASSLTSLGAKVHRSRTSSRPTSPSSATFGSAGPHWARRSADDRVSSHEAAEVCTPPMTSHAGPSARQPSAPRRGSYEQQRLPWQGGESAPGFSYAERQARAVAAATRESRIQSIYASSAGSTSSLSTIMDLGRTPLGSSRRQSVASDEPSTPDLPMFNIIPATPQMSDADEDKHAKGLRRRSSRATPPRSGTGLQDAAIIVSSPERQVAEAPMQLADTMSSEELGELPMIEIDLDFSPFSPVVDLPDETFETTPVTLFESFPTQPAGLPPSEPLPPSPPSPPFESYGSLPSLASVSSSLSTSSSLYSFPDVDEALGSMLASLSDPSLPTIGDDDDVFKVSPVEETWSVEPSQFGLGLGLGLGLGSDAIETASTPSVTQPLAPRPSRRAPPPPLVLVTNSLAAKPSADSPVRSPSTMSLMKNHRVAFYHAAKAHPASPTAGVFIGLDGVSPGSSDQTPCSASLPPRSDSGYFPVFEDASRASTPTSARSSTSSLTSSDSGCISRGSLSSGDDEADELAIRTASIISLTPGTDMSFPLGSSLSSPVQLSFEQATGWAAKSHETVGWALW